MFHLLYFFWKSCTYKFLSPLYDCQISWKKYQFCILSKKRFSVQKLHCRALKFGFRLECENASFPQVNYANIYMCNCFWNCLTRMDSLVIPRAHSRSHFTCVNFNVCCITYFTLLLCTGQSTTVITCTMLATNFSSRETITSHQLPCQIKNPEFGF